MAKIGNNQKGFSGAELTLVILIVVLAGVAGWLVYKNHHRVNYSSNTTSSPSLKTNTPASPSGPGFQAAKAQWEAESVVYSNVAMGAPLSIAVIDLQSGLITDTGNKSGYAAAISEIKSLETIPDAMVTPAQSSLWNVDNKELDAFFGSPSSGHNSNNGIEGPEFSAASKAWATEPTGTANGVSLAPLKEASVDLQNGINSDPGTTYAYPAAIADLQNLELATNADIATGDSNGGVVSGIYGADIYFLNSFFQINISVLGGQ